MHLRIDGEPNRKIRKDDMRVKLSLDGARLYPYHSKGSEEEKHEATKPRSEKEAKGAKGKAIGKEKIQ